MHDKQDRIADKDIIMVVAVGNDKDDWWSPPTPALQCTVFDKACPLHRSFDEEPDEGCDITHTNADRWAAGTLEAFAHTHPRPLWAQWQIGW